MTLIDFLCNSEPNGPSALVLKYVGHHDVTALSQTCRALQALMASDQSQSWRKFFVIGVIKCDTISQENVNDITATEWRNLSELVHSRLRKRKALSPLKLSSTYRRPVQQYDTHPRDDYNDNLNLFLLMGNNGTESYADYKNLPNRFQNLAWRTKQAREAHYKKFPYDGEWNEAELSLVTQAGHHGMKRVGRQVRTVVEMIGREMPSCLPQIATSGRLSVGLDPKLRINGSTLGTPLCSKLLDETIRSKNSKCEQSSFGVGGTRRVDTRYRDSWSLDLGTDVQITDATFQKFLSANMASNPGGGFQDLDHVPTGSDRLWWPVIGDKLMPALRLTPNDATTPYRLVAKPNKMLIYSKGSHFEAHRDQRHGEGHFGTLILRLPVKNNHNEQQAANLGHSCRGSGHGDLVVYSEQADGAFRATTHAPPDQDDSPTWHVLMLGTSHEVERKYSDGYRVALTFTLWIEGTSAPPMALYRMPRLDLLSV